MILFLKKIFNSSYLIIIRNLIGFRPVKVKLPESETHTSISDAFIWRTDHNYHTIFRFSDILKKFYIINQTSQIEIIFYNSRNKKIKSIVFKNNGINNELIIDKKLLNNTEDYGIFYIYHSTKEKYSFSKTITLSNRCYVGYSQNMHNPSFVHGNYLARFGKFGDKKEYSNLVQKSFFFNKKYVIQTDFFDFDKTELLFANPMNTSIKFRVNGEQTILNGGALKILEFNKIKTVEISSKLFLFRPIVFNYKGKFIDVFHA